MLVIIGADKYGEKDVLAIMNGLRQNADALRPARATRRPARHGGKRLSA